MEDKNFISSSEEKDGVEDTIPSFFRAQQLDQKSLDERVSTIGGSDINILASGDDEAIRNLYIQKRDGINNDLSGVWPVLMGIITEELNTEWTAWKNDIDIVDRQRVIRGKKHPFMRCTLDGVVRKYKKKSAAVYDAKFTLGRPLRDETWADVIPRLIHKYTPQLHWNAYLVEEADGVPVDYGILSIVRAGNEPSYHEIPIDKGYQEELIKQASFFMNSLKIGLEPAIKIEAEAPTPVEERVPYDMDFHKNSAKWKSWADLWRQTQGAAETFKKAEAEIKKLVPKDAAEATGGGIKVKVAKNNSKKIEIL